MELEQLEKGGFEHFMLKEIFEQPKPIFDSLRYVLMQRIEFMMEHQRTGR